MWEMARHSTKDKHPSADISTRGLRDADSIAERLLASSMRFARLATSAYVSEEWDLFYLHLATSVEQLLKGVLAQAHPSFIADARANFDSLLHLCGFGSRARTPDFVAAVRTVTATEALLRVERVVDGYREPSPRIRLLLEIRNGIIHVGDQGRGQAGATLGDVGSFVETLLPSLGLTNSDYWGDRADMVASLTKRRLSEIEAGSKRALKESSAQGASATGKSRIEWTMPRELLLSPRWLQ